MHGVIDLYIMCVLLYGPHLIMTGTGQPQLVRAACPLRTEGGFGICIESCSKDSGCEEGELCCSNGCGHVCMAADNDSPPHYKSQRPDGCRDRCAWQKMTLESSLAIGAYIPQCDEDGHFLPVQVLLHLPS